MKSVPSLSTRISNVQGNEVGMLPFYLVQGSNENGVVSSTTTSVSVPDGFDWDQAVQSTNGADYQDFFLHFPTSSSGAATGDNGQIRNPLDVCRQLNNLCN